MLEPLTADVALFLYINQSLANPALDFLLPLISHLGSIWLWAPLSIIALHYRKLLGKRMVIGLIMATPLVVVLKELIARPRPFDALEGVRMLDMEAFAGFPSGHTTIAFLVAFFLSKEFPKYRIPFYTAAALVGFSRVYVGMHFPLDVLAGAIIGLAAGYIVLQFVPKKPKKAGKHRRRKQ